MIQFYFRDIVVSVFQVQEDFALKCKQDGDLFSN